MHTLDYYPDATIKENLKNSFRYWHVESLLNQSANLIDRCINDLKEYNSLDVQNFNLLQEISFASKELDIEEHKLDGYFREAKLADIYIKYLSNRATNDKVLIDESLALYVYIRDNPEFYEKSQFPTSKEALITHLDKIISQQLQQQESEISALRRKYIDNDITGNRELLNIRKSLLETKKGQLENGRILDLQHQKNLIWSRLKSNFDDCLNRCVVAAEGINIIYGDNFLKQDPIKTLDELLSEIFDVQEKITNLYIWIYDAIKNISSYLQLEQSFTLCFSLRSFMSESEFETFNSSEEYFYSHFNIPTDLFPHETYENIRFKGIGASLIGSAGKIPWRVEVRLPENAVYFRQDQIKKVNQSDIPLCLLGRVENKESIRSIEYCGLISLNNASPIADADEESFWSIKIQKPASKNESFRNIEDVIIELSLNGKLH